MEENFPNIMIFIPPEGNFTPELSSVKITKNLKVYYTKTLVNEVRKPLFKFRGVEIIKIQDITCNLNECSIIIKVMELNKNYALVSDSNILYAYLLIKRKLLNHELLEKDSIYAILFAEIKLEQEFFTLMITNKTKVYKIYNSNKKLSAPVSNEVFSLIKERFL